MLFGIYRNDKRVLIGSKMIRKTFTGPEAPKQVEQLLTVYERLQQKNVPHVDRLLSKSSDGTAVYLGPRGVPRLPGNIDELINAVTCVLEALVVCHLQINANQSYQLDI